MTINISTQVGVGGDPNLSYLIVSGTSLIRTAQYRAVLFTGTLEDPNYQTLTPLGDWALLGELIFVVRRQHGSTYRLEISLDGGATWSNIVAGSVRSMTVPAQGAESLQARWASNDPAQPGYHEAQIQMVGLTPNTEYAIYLQANPSAAAGTGRLITRWTQPDADQGLGFLRVPMPDPDQGFASFTLHKRTGSTWGYTNVVSQLRPYVEVRRFRLDPLEVVVHAAHLRPGQALNLWYLQQQTGSETVPSQASNLGAFTPTETWYRWETVSGLLAALDPAQALNTEYRAQFTVGYSETTSVPAGTTVLLPPGTSTEPVAAASSSTEAAVDATADLGGFAVDVVASGLQTTDWWRLIRFAPGGARTVWTQQGAGGLFTDFTAPLNTDIYYELHRFATKPTAATVPTLVVTSKVVRLDSVQVPAFTTDRGGQWAVVRDVAAGVELRAGLADVAWGHGTRTGVIPVAGAAFPAITRDTNVAPSGDLVLITPGVVSRDLMLRIAASRNTLFLRAPCVPGVDGIWFVIAGDVEERVAERTVPAARAWQIPIQIVAEPDLGAAPFGALT